MKEASLLPDCPFLMPLFPVVGKGLPLLQEWKFSHAVIHFSPAALLRIPPFPLSQVSGDGKIVLIQKEEVTVLVQAKPNFIRVVIMIVCVIIEAFLLLIVVRFFSEQAAWIEGVLRLLSIIIVLTIIRRSEHLSSDMLWIILIMFFPVPGTAAYLLLGADLIISRTFRNIVKETERARDYYFQDIQVLKELEQAAPMKKGQFHYISQSTGFPFYRNTGFDYYRTGEEGFPFMLEEMEKAQRFIFLEYFIIEPGEMWYRMLQILQKKAREGVECRVLYDDMGSFGTLPASYAKELEKQGIKSVPFNRITPVLGTIMNHRDHRKILVIDGKVAFSGGINLADEYINRFERFGYWKDNLIRIKGEAVWSYTVLFLTTWNALRHEDNNYMVFKADSAQNDGTSAFDGYIAAYGDTPLDDEITSQNIYMNILNQAVRYCYIITPYLIIDNELTNALLLTAKRGVDVRILTPGIPDKRMIWMITRSYYEPLMNGGVKIYEYTPGFVHGKVFIADDDIATVGTINLDYRSLYLHFENGTYLYGSEKVLDIRNDYLDALKVSKRIEKKDIKNGIFIEILIYFMRLFTPLL